MARAPWEREAPRHGASAMPAVVALPLASELFPGQNLLVILVVLLVAATLLVLLSVVVVAVARRLWRWATGSAPEPKRPALPEDSLARRLAPVPPTMPASATTGHDASRDGAPARQRLAPDAWPQQASAVLDQYFQRVAALGEADSAAPADQWVEQVAVRLPGLGRTEEGAR